MSLFHSSAAVSSGNDEQIAHQAESATWKIGALGVVHGHDHLAVLHAGKMLDRSGDAHGEVELGRDDFAGLADW